jgi:predicted extracellular nuclease
MADASEDRYDRVSREARIGLGQAAAPEGAAGSVDAVRMPTRAAQSGPLKWGSRWRGSVHLPLPEEAIVGPPTDTMLVIHTSSRARPMRTEPHSWRPCSLVSTSLPMPIRRGSALFLALALALGALLPLAAPPATSAAPTELFFSEYIEGSSNNKALEIYNGTGAAIDLAAGDYEILQYSNGSVTAGNTFDLSGTVAAGDVFVFAHSSASPSILAQADATSGAGLFNGDDALAFVKADAAIDVIGQIGFDPGSQWGSGLASTADNTLRRKAGIEAGDSNGTDAFDPSVQWDGFATDTFNGLGCHSLTGAACTPPPPPTGEPAEIAQIQGAGHVSPLDGDLVSEVEGVVTAIRPFGSSRGFWMEDPTPDADTATSEGIFVFTGSTPSVVVGSLVEVDGTVQESQPFNEDLPITRIANATWEITAPEADLPNTVIGIDRTPPTVVISDDSTNVVANSPFDPANDGIDFWESLEGMRLSVADAIAVGPTNRFGEVAVVSQLQETAGPFTPRGGLLVENLSGTGDYRTGDFNPERLLLDDALFDTPSLNVGDGFETDPVGVLDQSFGAFKLLVTEDPGRIDNGLQREVANPAGPQELAVATFNVENLSARDCVNDPDKVAGLASQIVTSLRSPDLIAIEEMQDNSGDEDDTPNGDDGTVASDASWQCLIDAVVAAGGPLYDYRQIDPLNNTDGGIPGGNIRVGFLFHSERGLEFVDRPGGDASTDTDVVLTPSGKGARLTISPGRVLDAELGGAEAFADTRKSLAGEFTFRGETIFVVANHFSSKGDDRPLYSWFQPPFRFTEFESGTPEDGWRHAQAQAVNDFVDEILAVDADAHVIVLGDINDFDFSETVGVLTGELVAVAGGADADGSGPTAPGGDPVMATLFDLLPAGERYSYVFEGNSQVLDQILVSNSLIDLDPTYDVVHVNSEFWDQVSDHDPSVMKVSFQPPASD